MKKMVLYFSPTGTTQEKALELAEAEQAYVFEIQPSDIYTGADLDWTNQTSRSSLEMKDLSCRPEIAEMPDLEDADEIFIGFPIWWGVAPRVIDTFLDQANLTGKKIIPFATSGGSRMEHAEEFLKKMHPQLDFEKGKLLNGRLSSEEIKIWADRL